MDNRSFLSGASGTAPSAPVAPSVGFPTGGNPSTSTPPTNPGPFWYHAIGEEIRAVLVAASVTPVAGTLNQLLTSLNSRYAVLNSPSFTGVPLSPTPAAGDNSTKIASTAFVAAALAAAGTVLSTGGVPYGFQVGSVMVQFGFNAAGSGDGPFSFTTAFPTACLAVLASTSNPASGAAENLYAYPVSRTQYAFGTKQSGPISHVAGYWVAFGY